MSGAVARRPERKATASAARIKIERKRLLLCCTSRRKSFSNARMSGSSLPEKSEIPHHSISATGVG